MTGIAGEPHFDQLVLAALREGSGTTLHISRRVGEGCAVPCPSRPEVFAALLRLELAGEVVKCERHGHWRAAWTHCEGCGVRLVRPAHGRGRPRKWCDGCVPGWLLDRRRSAA